MKHHAAGEQFAHHGDDVFLLERRHEKRVAHAASRRIGHFGVLQMIFRAEGAVVAGVIVMQMRHDHVLDFVGLDADRLETIGNRPHQRTLAFLAHRLVETGIDDISAVLADDRPDVIVERLKHVRARRRRYRLGSIGGRGGRSGRRRFRMFLRRS